MLEGRYRLEIDVAITASAEEGGRLQLNYFTLLTTLVATATDPDWREQFCLQ